MSLARVVDPSRKVLLASIGAVAFILALGALDQFTHGAIDLPALIPPFGASTVIVFFAPDTLASRAWNVIVGHLGSALAAALVLLLLPGAPLALHGALAVAAAGMWMVASRSVHPPGGATALFAILGGRALHLGALLPLFAGCALLVTIRWLLDQAIALRAGRAAAELNPGS